MKCFNFYWSAGLRPLLRARRGSGVPALARPSTGRSRSQQDPAVLAGECQKRLWSFGDGAGTSLSAQGRRRACWMSQRSRGEEGGGSARRGKVPACLRPSPPFAGAAAAMGRYWIRPRPQPPSPAPACICKHHAAGEASCRQGADKPSRLHYIVLRDGAPLSTAGNPDKATMIASDAQESEGTGHLASRQWH